MMHDNDECQKLTGQGNYLAYEIVVLNGDMTVAEILAVNSRLNTAIFAAD